MSAAKHTPGPWHAEGNHIVAGSVRIAVVDTPRIHAGVDEGEAAANVALLAAAEELLAWAIYAQRYLSGDKFQESMRYGIAQGGAAAIAKATGSES